MKSFGALVVAVALVASCGSKKDPGAGSAVGSGSAPVVVVAPADALDPNAKTCPAGNALKDGACVVVVTAEKVEAVAQQQTRLDELATVLDKAEVLAAPIELLNAIRQLDAWKKIAGTSDKFKIVEEIVARLGDAVQQLALLKVGLKEGSVRLGNIKGELTKVLDQTGAAKRIEDLQADISKDLNAAFDQLSKEVVATVQKVLLPIKTQLTDVSDLVIGACAMAKLSGGSDQLKALCEKARDVFTEANTFLKDFEKRPTELFAAVRSKLEGELSLFIDAKTKTAMDMAQKAVDDALKLPVAAGSGSGSGSAH